MDRNEFDAWEQRIEARADRLWQAAGQPDGGADRFREEARELVALEEILPPTHDPYEPEIIEEASLQRNLGEFPTLVDQGEEQTFPDAEADGDDDGPRLSDGDASDTGGVLPDEDTATSDIPDVSVADADVTTDAYGDASEADDADLNDDWLVDQPSLDSDGQEDRAGVSVLGKR